ncbi:hypothetical protein THC_0328 [Caldimicrobium thiodismutans]|jgi:CBS domain-containing protein|uniref:CBS domain-containing protein n=1 Tax=Caldimicrobium thiodismutans TaxID=1653476 RepID=A0A0U4N0J6_9BACT|nr:CBS domain-containing protein [Caldimicrobium thiodismutans]BAU22726.1 hypothetical protein THC_0328 [Caldimicrobium thiodismutans]
MGKGKIVGIVTTTENETPAQALEKMINYGIGRLLVVDSEKKLERYYLKNRYWNGFEKI